MCDSQEYLGGIWLKPGLTDTVTGPDMMDARVWPWLIGQRGLGGGAVLVVCEPEEALAQSEEETEIMRVEFLRNTW